MEITDVAVEAVQTAPDPTPIADALQTLPGAGTVTVTVELDTGITGEGSVGFGRISGAPATLAALIEAELTPHIIGSNPNMVRAIRRDLQVEVAYHGAKGLATFGIAAIDTAIWDALGKARGVPCWQLWGGVKADIPAYAMVGWSNYDDEKLYEVCAQAVDQGFRGVKIKVGAGSLDRDITRIEIARDAVGPDRDLMVDANQTLTTKEAIRRAAAYAEYDVEWFEEPLPADDVDGYARLTTRAELPIASGENCYAIGDVTRLLRREAIDIVQPDRRRMGGPTGLLDVAAVAHGFGIPYTSHGGDPAHLHVLACTPTATYLETGLLDENTPFALDAGCVAVPTAPGIAWS